MTGLLSLLADALHSVTDSVNNVLGLTAQRLANPQPDRNRCFGLACFRALKGADHGG